MYSFPHQSIIGKRLASTRLTVVRRPCGHESIGPSGVFDQSKSLISRPILVLRAGKLTFSPSTFVFADFFPLVFVFFVAVGVAVILVFIYFSVLPKHEPLNGWPVKWGPNNSQHPLNDHF